MAIGKLSLFERVALPVAFMSWIIALPFMKLGPSVEGYFLPVVSVAVLDDPRPFPPPAHRHLWSASAEKLRDCKYQRAEWFMGRRGSLYVPVTMGFTDPPALRPSGDLHWQGLYITLDPVNVSENSFAYAYHICGSGIFAREVRSLFYDSSL